MKKLINITSFTAFLILTLSCSSGSSKTQSNSEMQKESAETYYTCTMHPEVHSNRPGNCPKCGMELVKKEITVSDSTIMQHQMDSK